MNKGEREEKIFKSLTSMSCSTEEEPSNDPEFCLVGSLHLMSFPGGSVVKNLPASAGDTGDMGSIPGSGRFPGIGNGHPLQYSCLETPRTEEPGRLQSMGSQRAGRDWVTEQLQPTFGWLAPRVTPCHILRVIKLPSTALVITYPGPEVIRQICKP